MLGRGSFATVHEAVSRLTGEAYAVKVLKKHGGGGSRSGDRSGSRGSGSGGDGCYCDWALYEEQQLAQQQLDAILREATSWAQAQGSRFVARLEGLYEDDDHAYIVQELCSGGSIKTALEKHGCLPEREVAAVMRGVLDVLVECHSNSICYGDCKPANFMLAAPPPALASCADTALIGADRLALGADSSSSAASTDLFVQRSGLLAGVASAALPGVPLPGMTPSSAGAALSAAATRPRLAGAVRAVDFGCSRRYQRGSPLHQQCGTPLYMAPEMAEQRFDLKIDVWACGVMMYQMLVGRLPFWSNKSLEQVAALRPYEVLAAVRCHEVQYPRELWRGVSPEAQQLVVAMLQRNPSTRISAADALAHPWFAAMLGYVPRPSSLESGSVIVAGDGAVVAEAAVRVGEGEGVEREGERCAPAVAGAGELANNVVGFERAREAPAAAGAAVCEA